MGARIYLLSFSLDFVAVELETTISHQKSLSKPIKTTKNHHFLPLCLRFRWGWQKLKRTLYFQYQAVVGSSTHKLKFLNPFKNPLIPVKSSISPTLIPKSKYRPKYRKTLLKSTLSPISHLNQKPSIQTTFFLYKYKILRKIPTFTDYKLFTKNHINNIKFTLISNTKREINNVTKISNKNKIKEQKLNDITNNQNN